MIDCNHKKWIPGKMIGDTWVPGSTVSTLEIIAVGNGYQTYCMECHQFGDVSLASSDIKRREDGTRLIQSIM